MIRMIIVALFFTISTSALAWEYGSTNDEMRDIEIKTARLSSNNFVMNRFNDEVFTWIVLRDWPGDGRAAMLRLSSGSFDCPRLGCRVSAKFDEGNVIEYPAVRADSGNYDWIFISDRQSFERRLKEASHLILEVPMRRQGRQQFKFSVGGLEWP